jgi:DNA-binding transcriptional LysR family regulator
MDEFKPYAVFAETVAAGSMSAAARRLGMSPSAISQIIRSLERQAGVTLLHRSTRKLALTDAGERCYPHCRRLLEAADAAAATLVQARDAPTGQLRLAAPGGFGTHIATALAPLLAQSPKLRLRLHFDDAMIDLIDARIDLAVRVGHLADSNWTARPLGALAVILCASPAYLERHGVPSSPDDLAGHHWLAFSRQLIQEQHGSSGLTERAPQLRLEMSTADGVRVQVGAEVRIASNNQPALHQLCEQGLGIARLSHAEALPALKSGALVRILPQWLQSSIPVTAVTPQRDREPAKVRLAVEALKRYFQGVATEAHVHRRTDL